MLIEARIIQKYTAEVYRYKMVKMYTERKGGGALFIPLIKGLLGLIFLYKLQFPMHWFFFSVLLIEQNIYIKNCFKFICTMTNDWIGYDQ